MIDMEHLTPEKIKALKDGLLEAVDAVSALEHIGECDRCADALAESYLGQELAELPAGFHSAVFSIINRESRVRPGKSMRPDNRWELIRYSFQVCVAACITLVLLFSGTINYGMDYSRTLHTEWQGVNAITENIRGFSDKVIHFEVRKYIKEEL